MTYSLDVETSLLVLYPAEILSYVHIKTCIRMLTEALLKKPQTINHLSGHINDRMKK